MTVARPLEERIANKIRVSGDCWLWTGGFTQFAPFIYVKVNRIKIRQYLSGIVGQVKVTCGNNACVNPAHIVRGHNGGRGNSHRTLNDIKSAFYSKIQRIGDCLVWQGCKDDDGRGVFSVNNQNQRVHRFIYELNGNALQPEQLVIFICNNSNCVNTRHHKIVSKIAFSKSQAKAKLTGRKTAYSPEFIRLALDLSRTTCVICNKPLFSMKHGRRFALCVPHSNNLSAALWHRRKAYQQKIREVSA